MPTVIDSLIVQLGLDNKTFVTGQKETERGFQRTKDQALATGNEMERRGKQAASFFSQIGKEVAAVLATFLSVRAIASFTTRITQADRATGQLAENLGMTARELSIWQTAIQSVGGSAGEVEGDMRKLLGTFLSWKYMADIPEPLLKAFARLNIDGAKFLDKTVPIREKLMMLATVMEKLEPDEKVYFGGLLGLSESLVNLIKNGPAALQAILTKSEQINALNKEDVEAAKKRAEWWWEISNRIERAGRTLLTSFNPHLEAAFKWTKDILDTMEKIAAFGVVASIRKETPQLEGVRARVANAYEQFGRLPTIYDKMMADKRNDPTAEAWAHNLGNVVRAYREFAAPVGKERGSSRVGGIIRNSGAPGEAGGPLSAVSHATGTIIRELLNFAQTNREHVLGSLGDFAKSVPAKDQASFLAIMRRELGAGDVNSRLQGGGGPVTINHNDTRINTVEVNTQATDAQGIANDIGAALRKQTLAGQANSGMGN